MNVKIWPFLITILGAAVSCRTQRFEFPKNELGEPLSNTYTKLNTNGCYFNAQRGQINFETHNGAVYSIGDSSYENCDFMFFYGDGMIYIYPSRVEYNKSIASAFNDRYFDARNGDKFRHVGRWGAYSIKDSVIFATVYRHNPSMFRPWLKEVLKMKIVSPDTVFLTQSICDRCKNQVSDYDGKRDILFTPPKTFVFMALSAKPDSTLGLNLRGF